VGADVINPEALIDESIKDYLSTILAAAVRLPGTRFGLVMPLQRPAVAWYQEKLPSITNFIEDGIRAMVSDRNINNVMSIACVSAASQQFEPDQIHLTKSSAKTFLEVTLGLAETFFNAPFVDLTEQGEIIDSGDAEHIARLEDRLDRLERTMRMQMDTNVANDLMFARVREETDAGSNKAKEDRIVINGLTSAKPLPEEQKPRIEALKEIVGDIFKSIIPNFGGKIVYLSQGKNASSPLPMVEVKLDRTDFAVEMRRAFADKKKKNQLGGGTGHAVHVQQCEPRNAHKGGHHEGDRTKNHKPRRGCVCGGLHIKTNDAHQEGGRRRFGEAVKVLLLHRFCVQIWQHA
jgi:hypothetical protein